jgi:cell division protein FtsW (lipid II flippase)
MPILIVGALLSCFGILAVYSVSIHESFTLTLSLVAKGLRSGEPSNYFYFFRQLRNVFMAVIAAGALYYIPISFFQKSKNIIIIFSLFMILQLAVFVPGIGVTLNGAR